MGTFAKLVVLVVVVGVVEHVVHVACAVSRDKATK